MKNLIFILAILILPFLITTPAKAQTASLYLAPSSGSFLVGSVFTVSIFVNTEGNEINTIWAELKFSSNILQVTSPTTGASFVQKWLTPPNYSNKEGVVSLRGGIPQGISTSAGLISSITFRAISSGTAKIEFTDDSLVRLNDGKGTDILSTIINGEYNILVPPPEGPVVFSPTHPNPNIWYSDPSPSFSWEQENGVTDFSWSFDQNSTDRPDGTPEGDSVSISFSDVPDGIWYFHLRQKKNGVWGSTSHAPVQIDDTPPEDFEINIEKTGQSFFAYFSAQDNFSGIDHYEVSTVEVLNPQVIAAPIFTETDHLYQIPYENSGKYAIFVRAYDKAGNYFEKKSVLSIVGPLLSYTENGIKLRGLFLPWWVIWALLSAILGVAGFAVYRLTRRRGMAERLKKEVREAEKEIKDVKEMEEKIQKMRALEEEARRESERLAEGLRNQEKK